MKGKVIGKSKNVFGQQFISSSMLFRWAGVRKEYDDSSLMYKYVTEDESR